MLLIWYLAYQKKKSLELKSDVFVFQAKKWSAVQTDILSTWHKLELFGKGCQLRKCLYKIDFVGKLVGHYLSDWCGGDKTILIGATSGQLILEYRRMHTEQPMWSASTSYGPPWNLLHFRLPSHCLYFLFWIALMMYSNVKVKAKKKIWSSPNFLWSLYFIHNRNTKLKADTEGEGIGGENATKDFIFT